MDLVKVGFIVQADGLKDAENQVDRILQKVDQLNKKKVNIPSGSSPNASGGAGKPASNNSSGLSTSERMLKTQQLLTTLLPTLDRQTANLVARFQLASNSVAELNQFLTLLGQNQAIVKQQKDAEKLAADQKRLADEVEAARQKKFAAEQTYYQKQMDLESKANAATIQAAEDARQKKFAAEQVYYQKQMELAKKEAEEIAKIEKKKADDAEKARQKKFSAEQKHYQQQLEQVSRIQQAEKNRLANQQKLIDTTLATTKYQQQGLSRTNAGKVARMEVSGADVTTVNQYKQALLDSQAVMNSFGKAAEDAGKKQGFFNTQVGGIVKYAVLSAVIYGLMTATLNLGAAIVKTADEYTSIQNRMKLYITDAQALTKVNARLAQYSVENNVGLRETATLFARLQPAMQKIGANTAAVTSVVDAFGKSMRIGGATAMEASSATLQFSQAMASGKLAGDEFRAISEASPRFLKAIADGSGIAAAKLKEMSSAGMLTTEVISKALLKEYPKLIEENKKLGVTLEQGTNAMKTAFTVLIGEFNEGAGITRLIGESMMDLAQGLLQAGQSARQTGKDIQQWFSDNAETIQTVTEVVKLLATVLAVRYVVSVGLATVASMKLAYSTSAMGVAATASARNFALAATAVTAFGRAAQTAFTFLGGLTGIALTVVGVAAAYLLLRDNAAEASRKIVEQSEYVNLTTASYKKLNEEQQKNAKTSLTKDLQEVNEKLESQKNAVDRVLLSYAQFKQMQGKALSKDVTNVINQTVKGLMSYDTAYRKLIELGAPKNVVEDFKKQRDIYIETAKSGVQLESAAKAAGVGIKLGGNEAQNASPAIRGLKNDMDDLGNATIGAADKFKELVNAYTQGAADIKTSLKLSQQYGLDQTLSDRVVKEARQLADADSRVTAQTAAVNKQKEAVAKLSAEQQKNFKQYIEQNEKIGQTIKNKVAEQYMAQLAPYAQGFQAAQDKRSAFDAEQRKKDKPPKKEDINNFPEQLSLQKTLLSYLQQGVDIDVARIAAQKDYIKWYGSNLTMAKQMVAVDTKLLEIEKEREKTKARNEAVKTLKEQIDNYDTINQYMKEGYSYSVAQKVVSSGFKLSAEGAAHANSLVTFELKDQLATTIDEIKLQEDLLDFVKAGLSVEEASAQVLIYRNKHLNQGMIKLAEGVAKAKEMLAVDKARLALEQESNQYKEQAGILVQTTKNELASIMTQYKGISIQEAESLQTRKDIATELSEYNVSLEKQKSLMATLETVNFDVFGDFGNPFQSALEGLNSLLFGMTDLEEKYKRMGDDLTARISKEAEGSKEQQILIAQKGNLDLKFIEDSKKARDAAITSGLSLTKAFFKEESKGYKIVSGLEKAYQAGKIAFALWEKKDQITLLALKLKAHITDALGFTSGAVTKLAAQQTLNVAQAQGAVASAANAPPPVGFASAAAMIALLAGIGIAVGGGFGGGDSGSYTGTENDGTGTVFGGAADDKSASIKNSIDLLADNSDLMLPINNSMLRSLQNIESAIGGVANLLVRGNIGEGLASQFGFGEKLTGTIGTVHNFLSKSTSFFTSFTDKLTGIAGGSMLNDLVGSVLGGLFGKTSQSVTASGLYGGSQSLGSILSGGMQLQEYADVATTKKSWFSKKTSYSTQMKDASAEIEQQFSLIFNNVFDSILAGAGALGKDQNQVTQSLLASNVSIGKINTQGKTGKEIQELLEGIVGQQADLVAKNALAGLDDFQKVGEGYYETLLRLASGVEQAQYFTERLNYTTVDYTKIVNKQGDVAAEILRQSVLLNESTKGISGGFYDLVNQFDGTAEELYSFIIDLRDLQDQIMMTGKEAKYLTTSMILGAGGMDTLSNGLDSYFEMLSPAEKAAELTRRLTNEFALFGQALPANVKAYRDLVSGIDVSTEAGQKLYGQVIALAPEFTDLQDALESADSAAKEARKAVEDLVKSLRDLAEQARTSRSETDQPKNLEQLRYLVNSDATLAMQGDTKAAERLLDLSKDLMSVSKQYSVTESEYARDLALIQRAATVSADVQEAGLGYTTPTLNTVQTAPATVATTNSSTDAKLEALREDMIAAITAVAKYTQDTANRLERWDYGDRMTVRIEQESDDAPLTVKVTP